MCPLKGLFTGLHQLHQNSFSRDLICNEKADGTEQLLPNSLLPQVWESVDLLQGSLGPSGPELEKESENEFRGLSAPGPKKSKTESKKSQDRFFFNYFDSFSTPFSTFWAPGPLGPGRALIFGLFFPTLGQKAPK